MKKPTLQELYQKKDEDADGAGRAKVPYIKNA